MIRHIYLFVALLLSQQFFGQEAVIKKFTDESGKAQSYVARDMVLLTKGFHYKPSDNTQSMIAKIDYTVKPPISSILVNDANYPKIEDKKVETSNAIGAIPASLNVTPSGAATYEIPISLPSGAHGLQPAFSVVYSSQSGPGLLGMGANLAGLSSITRVQHDIRHEGYNRAIAMNSTDKFALDGNRLILTSAGTYGANDSKYHTEVDNFAEITLKTNGDTNPDWFMVTTKDGQVMEYGNGNNSKVTAVSANSAYMWYLTKVTDKYGNYMIYHYRTESGAAVIDYVEYNGNANVGLKPIFKVQFKYGSRLNNENFINGSSVRNTFLIEGIQVFGNSTLLSDYKFAYANDNYIDQVPRLFEVVLKNGSGEQLNSTQLDWGSEFRMDNAVTKSTSLPKDLQKIYPIDFNNDGKTDFLAINKDNLYLYQSTGTDYKLIDNKYIGYGERQNPSIIFNNGVYEIYFEMRSHTDSYSSNTEYASHESATGDNSDCTSCQQFIASYPSGTQTNEATGMTYFYSTSCNSYPVYNSGDGYIVNYIHDCSVSGYQEAYVTKYDHFKIENNKLVQIVTPDDNLEYANLYQPIYRSFLFGDFSGNGKQQKIVFNINAKTQKYAWPSELNDSKYDFSKFRACEEMLIIDFDGDGQSELFAIEDATAVNAVTRNYSIYKLSTANVFEPIARATIDCEYNTITKKFDIALGNLNGDGQIDMISTIRSNKVTKIYLSDGVKFRLPTSGDLNIEDISFNYENETKSSIPELEFGLKNKSVSSNYMLVDMNNDGLDDIVEFRSIIVSLLDLNSNFGPLRYYSFGYNTYYSRLDKVVEDSYFRQRCDLGKVKIRYNDNQNNIQIIDACVQFPPYTRLTAEQKVEYQDRIDYTYRILNKTVNDVILSGWGFISYDDDENLIYVEPIKESTTTKSLSMNVYFNSGAAFSSVHNLTLDEAFKIDKSFIGAPSFPDFTMLDIDGDGRKDLFYREGDVVKYKTCKPTHDYKLVKTIVNGAGSSVSLNYKSISEKDDDGLYTPSTNATHPYFDICMPLTVVKSVTNINAIGTSSEIKYSYSGLKAHLGGFGLMGFSNFKVTNSLTGNSTENIYDINTTYNLPELRQIVNKKGFTILSSSTNTYTYLKTQGNTSCYFSYPSSVDSYDGFAGTRTIGTTLFNEQGQLLEQKKNFNNIGYELAKHYYANGQNVPYHTINESKIGSEPVHSQATAYAYKTGNSSTTNELLSTTTNGIITTITGYDGFGNPLGKTVSAPSCASCQLQTESYIYDATGRFVVETTTSAGTTKARYDLLGKLLMQTGIDNKSTTYEYDSWGRQISTTTPEGHTIKQQYSWALGEETVYGATSLTKITTTAPGKPSSTVWYDALDREIRNASDGFNGTIKVDMAYNNLGQLIQKTDPYYSAVGNTTTYEYDNVYGYLKLTKYANKLTTQYQRSGLYTTVTTPDGKRETKTSDAMGNVLTNTDKGGNTINYTYFSNGKVKTITTAGAITTIAYDTYGNQSSLTDPNTGTIKYNYNAFGQLKSQTDANGQTTQMDYDAQGRLTSQINAEGTTSYSYVVSGAAIGAIETVSSPVNSVTNTYDNNGRLVKVTEVVKSATAGNRTFETSYTYDAYGNVTSEVYPSGYKAIKNYNTHGYLTSVNDGLGNKIWEANAISALGHVESYKLGEINCTKQYDSYYQTANSTIGNVFNYSYSFDELTGNLKSRKDNRKNLIESFSYDNYDRLLTSAINGIEKMRMTYSNNGNIVSKTGAGKYIYNGGTNQVKALYDNTGSMQAITQNISYTSTCKTATVSQGADLIAITYGVGDNRCKMDILHNNTVQLTRYYIGGYEEEVTNSQTTRRLHYISGGDGVAAIYIDNATDASKSKLYYIATDHLGSIMALVNQDGTVDTGNEFSYDAWGRRRNADTWDNYTPTEAAAQSLIIYRGYTGHEHLDQFGLINMNGRMYDPVLARFLCPDNYVQEPSNSQSFNRYSYCWNNPLKYTDPSGEFLWILPNIGWDKSGGLSIGVSFGAGFPGGLSVQFGFGYNFGSKDGYGFAGVTVAMNTFSVSFSSNGGMIYGYSFGLSPFSGFPISSNAFTVGVNYSFEQNCWSGNISAWSFNRDGFTFNPSVSVIVFGEHTTNASRGKGFRSNDGVFRRFNDYNEILKYFEFEGTYHEPSEAYPRTDPGYVDPKGNGDIHYSYRAFDRGYDKLAFVHDHESRHSRDVKSGKYKSGKYAGRNLTKEEMSEEEFNTYIYNYKREGLYRNHTIDIRNRINEYGTDANINYARVLRYNWERPLWHQIYRIPRLW